MIASLLILTASDKQVELLKKLLPQIYKCLSVNHLVSGQTALKILEMNGGVLLLEDFVKNQEGTVGNGI